MSVKVRKIGATWGVVVHHQGNRWKKSVGSKKAAEVFAARLEVELTSGTLGMVGEIPTFSEYIGTWLEYIALARAPSTLSRYRGMAQRAAKHIGAKPLNTITRGDIRDLLLKEFKGGSAKASVELMHSVLSGIFHHALDDGYIDLAPTTRVMVKLDLHSESEEINPLSSEEMQRALDAVDQQMYPLFLFLFQTGARIGEALAITWGDIDLVGRKISINKTAKDQRIRMVTKTRAARSIDMSEALLPVLQQLKAIDTAECKGRGETPGLVFHKQGRILSDNTIRRKWAAACETIGIGHRRLHDIRHTTASLLLARSVPVTYVAKMLGHSSPKITFDKYAHYIPAENQGMINVLTPP